MFWFYATARKIEIKKSDILVSDSINVYPCKFQFSAEWNELVKTAVFRAGSTAIEVLLDENYECNIPWEVLLKDKLDLYVGCYGTKGEDVILNTTWTNIGKIYEGTKNKAVPGEDPTPDIYTQIISSIGDLNDLETSDKSNLVNAINEVKNTSGSGGGGTEPTPAGVASFNGRTGAVIPKQGDYTAEMVGAVSTFDFETFRENTEEDINRLTSDTADKVDKTGGTVTGPIMFSDSVAVMAYTYEDEPVEAEQKGIVVSSTGILKSSDGPLNISSVSQEVVFGHGTKLSGVTGDESTPSSVPNMNQVNAKITSVESKIPTKVSQIQNDTGFITSNDIPTIPTKTSQLTNDSNFATEQYVTDKIADIEGGEGVVGPPGPQGPAGENGENGVTFIPSVSADGIISWTNDGSLENPTPVDIMGPEGAKGATGETGPAGENGFSPTVSISPNANQDGTTVTITDVNGPHSFDVLNGLNGEDATINGENTLNIVAGENISIEQAESTLTISASASSQYTAGDGITIESNEISVTTPVKSVLSQTEFDALPDTEKNSGLYLIEGQSISDGSSPSSDNSIPSGFIGMWSGATVPDGWALCNGENGTPDLRGRFILGKSESYEIGNIGGSEEVTLTIGQMPTHNHYVKNFGINRSDSYTTASYIEVAEFHNSYSGLETNTSGASEPHNNMPPYYVLAYIMKL